ncbi:pyridoxamine 5'-phosphate oxidase family protein [Streptomyces sp. NPDC050549]|uniref:pyridoxamine 5'-phosphate oxidase family protein n=1 Tax=Streptomyces sp. NPDC050549 TaxID=3155406 RepID=UPI00344964C9
MTVPYPGSSAGRMIELGREESLALLASVPMGRVGFSHQALPVIRPVNHLVDGDHIVIRTHTASALLRTPPVTEVVVYEADWLDPGTRTGWSVMVTGRASPVTAASDVLRYQQSLMAWTDRDLDHVVRISAEIVAGYRIER